jgi:DNA-binding transcriptional MocR family regulator
MDLVLDGQGNLYEQVARALRRAILDGTLVAGSRLPSTRALAIALGISRKSIVDAYELICAEQLAVARAGSGTRVSNRPRPAADAASTASQKAPTRYVERLRNLSPLTLAWQGEGDPPRYNLQCGQPLPNPRLFNSWRRKLSAAAARAGAALRSLDSTDRVIYLGTFSKTLFPSLRLGFIVCPKQLSDDLYKTKRLDDFGSPAVEQAALATFIQSRQYERHLRQTVKDLQQRRNALVTTLQRRAGSHLELGPHQGGMHFITWLKHLSFAHLDALIERGASMGLGLHPVHPYYHVTPARPGLLIGYGGLSAAQLRTAADLLVQCVTAV